LLQIVRGIDHYIVLTPEFVGRITFRLSNETMDSEHKWS